MQRWGAETRLSCCGAWVHLECLEERCSRCGSREVNLEAKVSQGKTWAMCMLAKSLEHRSPGEARYLYLRAGHLGDPAAFSPLGRMYYFGRGGPRDPLRARRWLERAYLEPESAYLLGLMSFKEGKAGREASRVWWEISARGGMVEAMVRLGRLMREEGDFQGARKWWSRAGEPRIWYPLGRMLLRGEGGPVDPEGARECFRQASENGQAEAMLALGRLLGKGGRGWLKKAFRRGQKTALLMI